MLILIAGPYRSGTNDDPVLMKKIFDALKKLPCPYFVQAILP